MSGKFSRLKKEHEAIKKKNNKKYAILASVTVFIAILIFLVFTNSNPTIVFMCNSGADKTDDYTQAIIKGLQEATKETGIPVEIAYAEFENFDVENAELAGKYTYIMAANRDFSNVALKPFQKYILLDSSLHAKNTISIMGRNWERGYVAGYAAAQLSKTGKVGIVTGNKSSAMNDLLEGFTQGAKDFTSSIEVLSECTNGVYEEEKGKNLALGLYAEGADVLLSSSRGVIKAAKLTGKMCLGLGSNQNAQAPDSMVASIIKKIDRSAKQGVLEVAKGNFKDDVRSMGFAEESFEFSMEGSHVKVPPNFKQSIDTVIQDIINQKIKKNSSTS